MQLYSPFHFYQISGDLDIAKDALIQITSRLRANLFDGEGAVSALVPILPCLHMPTDDPDGLKYDSRDRKRHGHGHSYSGGYGGASDLPAIDSYGNYGGLQVVLFFFFTCIPIMNAW